MGRPIGPAGVEVHLQGTLFIMLLFTHVQAWPFKAGDRLRPPPRSPWVAEESYSSLASMSVHT